MDMFSLSKRRILTTAFKFKYNDSPRITWWLKDESLIPVARSITKTVRNITDHALQPDTKIFKLNERKAVFRVELSHTDGQAFVAKAFFLNRLEHKLKYHRYGLDEVANLLKAADKGINTPRVYGYGHLYSRLRLVEASVIILEDLPRLSPIKNLLLKATNTECQEIFMRTIPLFVSLYNAGCNHIDVNSGAVMLCERNLNPAAFLLDFQHAKFHDRPSSEILMFEAACFAKSCRDSVSTETINEWLDKLLTAVAISCIAERRKMIESFNYYFVADLSRKRRKKIR